MKILILYASKNGVTRECAETLCELLKKHDEVTLCSVKDSPLPSPADFDVAIVGSNIRMGLMNKEIKKYLKKHKAELSAMNTAVLRNIATSRYPRALMRPSEYTILAVR